MHESGEMYLETIYVLSQKSPAVHSIDVAEEMGFSKPSVSRGMGLLKKGELISVDDKGYIKLTEMGLEYAKKIYERHTVLTELLVSFGIDEGTAAEDACRIEHVISDKSMSAIKEKLNQ
ncbi:MAG: metal-dependent transcriptional regulator [Eubacterium sp.]|nr:metal-dependent transcriptional regulator [Eubacterium sp.]